MLYFPRLGWVLASLVCVAPLALAQNTPSLVGARVPAPNGFDKLFDAVENMTPADTFATDLDRLSSPEVVRQKRDIVARNKNALTFLRQALQLPVQHPPVRDSSGDFGNYNGFRSLASILDQESAVRTVDLDWNGAMSSKLDCIELGVLMTRGGPLRAFLAGRDIEIIGRRGIESLVARLDNEQSAAAAARLLRIETLRPPFADAIREGKSAALAITRQAFEQRDWNEIIASTTKLDGQPLSEDEIATLQTIGENEILGGIERTFDAALSSADAPYQPQSARVDSALDPWSALLAGEVNAPSLRVDYESARAQNRLLALALGLRVARLQTGSYPETLETAPDPFAPGAMLKYQRAGDAYSLYSVGPNAKDDGGRGLSASATGQVPPASGGDLLAPVLPL